MSGRMSAIKIVPGGAQGSVRGPAEVAFSVVGHRRFKAHRRAEFVPGGAGADTSARRPAPRPRGDRVRGVNGPKSAQGRTRPARYDSLPTWGDAPSPRRIDWALLRFAALYAAGIIVLGVIGGWR